MTAAIVVAATVATVLIYRFAGSPADQTTVLIVRSATQAPAIATDPPVNASTAAVAIAQTGAADAPTLPAPPPAFTNALLRPGAQLLSRVDLSLDGSTAGQVAVTSRYTVTSGCQPVFADVYALVGGTWQTVFRADDDSLPYGPILAEPQQSASGCYPRIRLFSGEPATAGGNALLILAAGYVDTSTRLVVIGWDSALGRALPLFDRRTGPYGSVNRSPDGGQIELIEDAPLPDAIAATGIHASAGRLTHTISLQEGAPRVTARRLAPPCEQGQIGAGTTRGSAVPATGRLLVLGCASGRGVSVAPDNALLDPPGITWADLRDGDEIQVTYDADSLELLTPEPALPALATLTDAAAGARHSSVPKPPQAPAQRQTAPLPATQPRPPAPAPPPRQQSAPRATQVPAQAPAHVAPAVPPAPLVTAPPAPRTPPFNGPPPIPR
jgi:hypothetical protein